MNFFRPIAAIVIFSFLLVPSAPAQADATIEENLKSVMSIACGVYENGASITLTYGSGVVAYDNIIVTNAHVAFSIDEFGYLNSYDWCIGGIAENSYTPPIYDYVLDYTNTWEYNEFFDYAFLSATDVTGAEPVEAVFEFETMFGNADSLLIGDDITLIGYPAFAGETITSTFGNVSGFSGTNWIKTDAIAEFGNSGGGAFDANGNIIGIPTMVVSGELNSITYIQNLNAILEDAFGADEVTRDYDTLYSDENIVCFSSGECYQYGEGDELNLGEDGVIGIGEGELLQPENGQLGSTSGFIFEGLYDPTMRDQSLINRLTGYILLQTEQHGEAWYLNPQDQLRYYMRDGAVAYSMMRSFGLGITDANLEVIPSVEDANEMLSASSVCDSNPLADQVKGQILLQVEQHGEAWYVHPDTCRRIYMKDGNAAYDIMRFLSLGISDNDLTKLPSGSIE